MTENLSSKTEVFRQKERGRKWRIVGWADKAQPPEALNGFFSASLASAENALNLNGIHTESMAGSLCIIVAIGHNRGFMSVCMG